MGTSDPPRSQEPCPHCGRGHWGGGLGSQVGLAYKPPSESGHLLQCMGTGESLWEMSTRNPKEQVQDAEAHL